jgi:hypothetical protein
MTPSKWLLLLALGSCSACSADQCELDDDLRLFAGDGARDCGTVGFDDDRAKVDGCVADAFDAEAPFMARYERQSTDSKVIMAVAANTEGKVKLFQWDSAPCGGPGCDAVTDVRSCDGAALSEETSEDPLALPISCERVGLPQRICG